MLNSNLQGFFQVIQATLGLCKDSPFRLFGAQQRGQESLVGNETQATIDVPVLVTQS